MSIPSDPQAFLFARQGIRRPLPALTTSVIFFLTQMASNCHLTASILQHRSLSSEDVGANVRLMSHNGQLLRIDGARSGAKASQGSI